MENLSVREEDINNVKKESESPIFNFEKDIKLTPREKGDNIKFVNLTEDDGI